MLETSQLKGPDRGLQTQHPTKIRQRETGTEIGTERKTEKETHRTPTKHSTTQRTKANSHILLTSYSVGVDALARHAEDHGSWGAASAARAQLAPKLLLLERPA